MYLVQIDDVQLLASDGCLNGTLIDTSDVSDKVVLVFVVDSQQ